MSRFVLSSLAVLAIAVSHVHLAHANETTITVDGKSYRAPVGKPFRISIGGKQVTMSIAPLESESFDKAGVAFQFPNGFKINEDTPGEAVTIWTIEGDNAALILQHYVSRIEPEQLLGAMLGNLVKQYGEENVQQRRIKFNAPETSYPGAALAFSMNGIPIAETVVAFANEQGSFTMILRDTRERASEATDEFDELVSMLGQSLKTGPPPKPIEPPKDAEQ